MYIRSQQSIHVIQHSSTWFICWIRWAPAGIYGFARWGCSSGIIPKFFVRRKGCRPKDSWVCTRGKDKPDSLDRDKEVSSSIRHINGVKEHEFSVQNRDAQIPAVAPDKQSGQFRELLVSAKEISRVGNVTGIPNSGLTLLGKRMEFCRRKMKKIRVNQDDKHVTRQQTRT